MFWASPPWAELHCGAYKVQLFLGFAAGESEPDAAVDRRLVHAQGFQGQGGGAVAAVAGGACGHLDALCVQKEHQGLPFHPRETQKEDQGQSSARGGRGPCQAAVRHSAGKKIVHIIPAPGGDGRGNGDDRQGYKKSAGAIYRNRHGESDWFLRNTDASGVAAGPFCDLYFYWLSISARSILHMTAPG